MPQTLIQVANSALIKIGAKRIATLTENSKEAETVNSRIRQVRDLLIRSHVWAFLRKVSAPAAVTSDIPPWAYYFAIPADCCRLLSIRVLNTHSHVTTYELIGSRIYTNATPVRLFYVRQPQAADEASELYQDDFAEAWACYLAAEISTAIYDSPERRQAWLDQYSFLIRQARFNGAVEGPEVTTNNDDWLVARESSLYDDRSIRGLDAPPGGV
jgi:hypothetical protein